MNGVKYSYTLEGASISYEFLRFYDEASPIKDFVTQRLVLELDGISVVDNLAVHHGEGERALRDSFNDMEIKHLFLPVYSANLNSVEEVV